MIKFNKGDFITQESADEVFAIWGGDKYVLKNKHKVQYSLTCYCDPTNFENKKPSPILSLGLHGNQCDYVINEEDLPYWRKCTQSEINKILEFLALKGYKWINDELQKLLPNEKLCFSDTDNADTVIPIKGSSYHKMTILKKKWDRQKISIIPMTLGNKQTILKSCVNFNNAHYPPKHTSYSSSGSFEGYLESKYEDSFWDGYYD